MIIIDSRKEHNMYENIKICAAAAIIFSPAVFDVFLCYQKLQIRKKKIDLKIQIKVTHTLALNKNVRIFANSNLGLKK